MTYADEFQNLAGIAIAMAGFAGIISALQSRPDPAWKGRYARLRELLLLSLGVVFFAFIPTLLEGVLNDPVWALRAPQILCGIYHVSLALIFLKTSGLSERKPYEWMVVPLAIVVVLIQFVTGFGYLSDYLAEAYFLGLLWLLLVAANNFMLLLLRSENSA